MIEIPEQIFLRHHIHGYIDDKKARKTIAALRGMHDQAPDSGWDITISSGGGCTLAGAAIYSELHSYSKAGLGPHRVTTIVRGQAASVASMIFQAGDLRVMGVMDTIMFHLPAISCEDLPLNKAKALVEECDTWIDEYAAIITSRSTLSVEDFKRTLGTTDWRLYHKEAIELGFADARG